MDSRDGGHDQVRQTTPPGQILVVVESIGVCVVDDVLRFDCMDGFAAGSRRNVGMGKPQHVPDETTR